MPPPNPLAAEIRFARAHVRYKNLRAAAASMQAVLSLQCTLYMLVLERTRTGSGSSSTFVKFEFEKFDFCSKKQSSKSSTFDFAKFDKFGFVPTLADMQFV